MPGRVTERPPCCRRLHAAQNTFIDKINGENASFETAVKYFTLADEYAPLYRKTKFQLQWVKMQRLTYSLIFTNDPKEDIICNIYENLGKTGAYLKCIVLARLMGYYSAISEKERELLAFLLDADDRGAAKEQIYNAIWRESDSGNIKNLIAVNLKQLKNDLECAGIVKSVVCRENRYFICRDKIACDIDLFEVIYKEFKLQRSKERAQKLLFLYKGEYLSDFEALWATANRIRYNEIYKEAEKFCL